MKKAGVFTSADLRMFLSAALFAGCTFLNGRAFHVTVGAEHAAIPCLRLEHGRAVRALVVKLTRIGRHGLCFRNSTGGACDRRAEFELCLFHN